MAAGSTPQQAVIEFEVKGLHPCQPRVRIAGQGTACLFLRKREVPVSAGWMVWMAFLFLFVAAGIDAGDGSRDHGTPSPIVSGSLTDS
jgi:hypothetical protein